jgi:uncharacterized protein YprB with RNaseH-like and TPR domain
VTDLAEYAAASYDEKQLLDKLQGRAPSVVMWDIEATSLSGMIGRILCSSFKPLGEEPYTFRGDRKPYRNGDIADDSALAIAIRDELEKYDVLVGHNSKLFDAKFLAARLFRVGERPRRKQLHVDTMWLIRSNLRMSSKLDNIQKFIGLPEEKSPIAWDDWARAGAWNRQAMDYVVEHCEQDVRVLEGVYVKLLPYVSRLVKG